MAYCKKCETTKKASFYKHVTTYCRDCFNSYNSIRRKLKRVETRALMEKAEREHPMITRAFIEHRLYSYKKDRGSVCEGCRSWQPIAFDTPDKCRSPKCAKYGEKMSLIFPKFHKEQEDRLYDLSVCRKCKCVVLDCRCEWKRQKMELRLMMI